MIIKNLDSISKIAVKMQGAEKVTKQLVIGKSDETPKMSLRVFTIEPGGNTPFHSHNYEHLNYIISGKGAILDDDGKENPVENGNFVLILPNEKHQFKNLSETEDFVFMCLVDKEFE